MESFSKDWLRVLGVAVVGVLALRSAHADVSTDTGNADVSAAPNAQLQEIVITARKREESALDAPILLNVITPDQIQNDRIVDFTSLAAATPGLTIYQSSAAAGAIVNLRGLGNGAAASFIDQSVLLNLDNVPLSQGTYYFGAMFDLGRIEILKGPQSLYYGKSATGGIIAIHSADPTPTWESQITQSYEINAKEARTEAYVSGPITDQLGIRIAGYFDRENGYLQNHNPQALETESPQGNAGGGRITLKYVNDDVGFRANLKYSLLGQNNNGSVQDEVQNVCEGATPQVAALAYDDCKVNSSTAGNPAPKPYVPGANYNPYNVPAFLAGNPNGFFRNGVPYQNTTISNAVLEMDYDILQQLTLTSVSSFSTSHAADSGVTYGNEFSPVPIPSAETFLATNFSEQDYSQELRMTSSFSAPVNFMAGAYFGRSNASGGATITTPTELPNFAGPGLLPAYLYFDNPSKVVSETYSPFAQLQLTPIPKVEVSAGLRYNYVKKYLTSLQQNSNLGALIPGLPQGQIVQLLPYDETMIQEHNLSPEVTLTWRPIDLLTTFFSYKQGYKGPAFNAGAASVSYFTPGTINTVAGETVKGVEGGVKGAFLDHTLTASLAAYNYKYNNLQVDYADPRLNENVLANAAASRIYGVELDTSYLIPVVSGLRVDASVYYNNAKYISFALAPCFTGQTVAQGCAGSIDGTGGSQSLAGEQLVNAPFVTGNLDLAYDRNFGNYHFEAEVGSNFSSQYNVDTARSPLAKQGGYGLLNAALHFGAASKLWEVAVVGRDLTNRYIIINGSDQNGVGVQGIPGDVNVIIARPLQVNLQLTFRPSSL